MDICIYSCMYVRIDIGMRMSVCVRLFVCLWM